MTIDRTRMLVAMLSSAVSTIAAAQQPQPAAIRTSPASSTAMDAKDITGGAAEVRGRCAVGVAQPRQRPVALRRVRAACAPAGAASRSRNTTPGGSEYTAPERRALARRDADRGARPGQHSVRRHDEVAAKTTDDEYSRARCRQVGPDRLDRALQLLKDLIAVDSVNPSLVPGAAGEAAIARDADRGDAAASA